MTFKRNKRGIRVKRCCASCKRKEIDNFGNRHCLLGFESHDTCRHWRMAEALRKCGTPFGVIKRKEYLQYVLGIRDKEMNSSCFVDWGKLRDINDIRQAYPSKIYQDF